MLNQTVKLTQDLIVLIADGNTYMRRLTRQMLTTIGVRSTYEVADGITALNTINTVKADVMILDWFLPGLESSEVMRIVRSPGVFPKSGLPVIMLTDVGLQSRVMTAIRVGAHELLIKPISPKILQQRLLGIALNPRPMVRAGNFYIPMPRRRVDLQEIMQVV
jgi:two-component system chemotaxis response regulator CheY